MSVVLPFLLWLSKSCLSCHIWSKNSFSFCLFPVSWHVQTTKTKVIHKLIYSRQSTFHWYSICIICLWCTSHYFFLLEMSKIKKYTIHYIWCSSHDIHIQYSKGEIIFLLSCKYLPVCLWCYHRDCVSPQTFSIKIVNKPIIP